MEQNQSWETIFQNCNFEGEICDKCQGVQNNSNLDDSCLLSKLYFNNHIVRYFKVTREIKIEDIEILLSQIDPSYYSVPSYYFWYGTILHASIDVLMLSANHNHTQFLLFLTHKLIKMYPYLNSEINHYEQTAIDILKHNMIDGFHARVYSKTANLDFILCSMFKNITNYTKKVAIIFNKLKDNVLFQQHKRNMSACFDIILFSPKEQVENKIFNTFKGGLFYLDSHNNWNTLVF